MSEREPPELPRWLTREEREAAAAAEAEAKRLKLLALIAQAPECAGGAELGAKVAADTAAGFEAREKGRRQAPVSRQLATYDRRSSEPPPPATSLPQNAKAPAHLPHDEKAEELAALAARQRAARQGRRDCDVAHFPAWAVKLARRGTMSAPHALQAMSQLPKGRYKQIMAAAAPFGGVDTLAGRNVLMLGTVAHLMGTRLRKRISGIGRGAWAALTRSWRGRHYSTSAIWHAVHDASGELDPELRGPEGGRVGLGKNRGFMVALSTAGVLVAFAPSAHDVPAFMVSASGWPFVQVVLLDEPPEPPADTS